MPSFVLIEKQNPLAVHGIFDTLEHAQNHLANTIPVYVSRGYFMDKSLTAESFEIVQRD